MDAQDTCIVDHIHKSKYLKQGDISNELYEYRVGICIRYIANMDTVAYMKYQGIKEHNKRWVRGKVVRISAIYAFSTNLAQLLVSVAQVQINIRC